MITLKKITIEGYKSIAKAEVELRDLNLIVGANGSGKSNFIGAFQLIYKYSEAERHKVSLGSADRILHHGVATTEALTITFSLMSEIYTFRAHIENGDLFLRNSSSSSRPGSKLHDLHLELPKEDANATDLDLHFSKYENYKRSVFSKLIAYHFHDASEKSPAKRENDLHDNRYFRPDAANLAAYLYRLKVNHPHEFSRIEDCIRLVAPYFEHFILEPQEIKGGFIKLEWKQKNSDAYFDAYSLSDGTLRFICLATLLMQPEPPALILLDEPELGLHPYAIALLAEMLASAATKSQLIIATQSVTLLNWMRPEDIIVAEHDGLATTFNRPIIETLTPWLEDFSMGDIWEKNLIGGRP